MVEHELQMADELSIDPGGDRWLMHVQGAGKDRVDRSQIELVVAQIHPLVLPHQGQDLGLMAGDRRQIMVAHLGRYAACL